MSVDLSRLGRVPANTSMRGNNIMIGYAVMSPAQTPDEEKFLEEIRGISQDLSQIKTAEGKLPVEEIKRILYLLAPKTSKTHMQFLMENAFKDFSQLRDDGSVFIDHTDFIGDVVSMFQPNIQKLLDASKINHGCVKAVMPKNTSEHLIDGFKALIQETFVIESVDPDGTLNLKKIAPKQIVFTQGTWWSGTF